MQDAITRDPEVMHGTPVFRGTRVPARPWMTFSKAFRGGSTLLRVVPQLAMAEFRADLAVSLDELNQQLGL